jgi:hypothetical protein
MHSSLALRVVGIALCLNGLALADEPLRLSDSEPATKPELLPPDVPARPRLDYVVHLDRLSHQQFDIQLEITGLPGDSLVLHGMPAYMDNPTASAVGGAVRGLSAQGAHGEPLRVVSRRDARGETLFVIRPAPAIVKVRYRLRVAFGTSPQTYRYRIANPYMNAERAWLYGNYLFVFPSLAPERHRAVRVHRRYPRAFRPASRRATRRAPGG